MYLKYKYLKTIDLKSALKKLINVLLKEKSKFVIDLHEHVNIFINVYIFSKAKPTYFRKISTRVQIN